MGFEIGEVTRRSQTERTLPRKTKYFELYEAASKMKKGFWLTVKFDSAVEARRFRHSAADCPAEGFGQFEVRLNGDTVYVRVREGISNRSMRYQTGPLE